MLSDYKSQKRLFSIMLLSLLSFSHAQIDKDNPICQDSLKIAMATYESDFFNFTPSSHYVLVTMPENSESVILIKGTHGYFHTPYLAEEIIYEKNYIKHLPSDFYNIFSLKIDETTQLTLVQHPFNWRTSYFKLFQLPSGFDLNIFLDKNSDGKKIEQLDPMFDYIWTPPNIYRHQPSGEIWLSKVENGIWQTYDANGVDLNCSMNVKYANSYSYQKFSNYPANGERLGSYNIFPANFNLFINLLDVVLGHEDPYRGSQDFINERRAYGHQMAFNTIHRPWAIEKSHGNSWEVIQLGLADWAKKAPENAVITRTIIDYYPHALNILKQNYITHFGLSEKDATEFAEYALRNTVSSFFAFNHSRYPDVKTEETVNSSENKFRQYKTAEIPFKHYVNKALDLTQNIINKIEKYYIEHGKLPDNLTSYSLEPASNIDERIISISIDQPYIDRSSYVNIYFSNRDILSLTLEIVDNKITWECDNSSSNISLEYLPKKCREEILNKRNTSTH